VDLRQDLERRLVLRCSRLHDIRGSAGEVPELDARFRPEKLEMSHECPVASCCGAGDCSVPYLMRVSPPTLSDKGAELSLKGREFCVGQVRRLTVTDLFDQAIALVEISFRKCNLRETIQNSISTSRANLTHLPSVVEVARSSSGVSLLDAYVPKIDEGGELSSRMAAGTHCL
jgi:hypothetical protein